MFMINHNLNDAVFGDDDILTPDAGDASNTNSLNEYVSLSWFLFFVILIGRKHPRERERMYAAGRE
jgi:hypothetical protein